MAFALLYDSIEGLWDSGCIEAEVHVFAIVLCTRCVSILVGQTMSLNVRRSWMRGVFVLRISNELFFLRVP
jgi:hypothetical protein